jgi:hypothetical protein
MTDIDYKAIADQLIAENERLRSSLVQIRLYPVSQLDYKKIADWIQQNYLVIVACCIAISTLISFIDTWRSHRGISEKA